MLPPTTCRSTEEILPATGVRGGSASLSDAPSIYSASMRPSGAGASIEAGGEGSRIGDTADFIGPVGTGSITDDIRKEIWT